MTTHTELTIGPLLFHWSNKARLDFWRRVADEAPVDNVVLGEAVCSKREPFFSDELPVVAERLRRGGKRVVLATLAQVVTKVDRRSVAEACAADWAEIEVNDASALQLLAGRAHWVGQYVNVYNTMTVKHLVRGGAKRFCLPAEAPADTIAELAAAAAQAGASVEVQAFGRVSLALSARCYHARAYDRIKDNCQFVCDRDVDGMDLSTRSGRPFLSINGIQTLSHKCLDLSGNVASLVSAGVAAFRLSPHTADMAAVASHYRRLLDGEIDASEAQALLAAMPLPGPPMNSFNYRQAGMRNAPA